MNYSARYALGEKILEHIAHENDWQHFEIVEDSYYFDHGLLLIGYEDEKHEFEVNSCGINLDAMKNNKLVFEKSETFDLYKWCKKNNI